jgi:hypothetical protein
MSTNAESFEQVIDSLATGINLATKLSLAPPQTVITHLQQVLDSLKAHPPAPDVYLDVLEQFRPPLRAAILEIAPLYRDRPLPLIAHNTALFRQVTEILQGVAHSYAHCAQLIQDAPHHHPEFARLLAQALHRSLYYASQFVYEHYYARQELPVGVWQEVHRYYAKAEQHNLGEKQVMDTRDGQQGVASCANLYVALLLVSMANLYGYNARDQKLIHHWAALWASRVAILPVESMLEIPPFIIDLAQDKPLHPASDSIADESARQLDISGLIAQIVETRALLAHKPVDPAQRETLGLGESSTGHARRLLAKLSTSWGLSASPRKFQRYTGSASGHAKLCSSFEHIHQAISGEDFKQPGALKAPRNTLGLDFAPLDSNILATGWRSSQQSSTFPTSTWDIVNYSANGFRLSRHLDGLLVAHGQLLALCQGASSHYLLGEACWLMQDENTLHMGVIMFPGIPQAVSVRPDDLVQEAGLPYLRAFLLPGLEKTNMPPTLVLPVGLFRAQRKLVLAHDDDDLQSVTLDRLWQHGLDYELVSYK